MLKRFIAKLEDVDEKYRDLYEKTEGGFILKTDDDDLKKKLDEFRTNNRQLFNERKTLEEKLNGFKDVDPTRYRELQERISKLDGLEDAELLKAGKLDEVIAKRTAAMKADFDARFGAKDSAYKQKESEVGSLRSELERLKIDGAIRSTIDEKKLRVRTGALTDVVRRARETWRINEKGQMVPIGDDGQTVFGKEGNVLSMEEFIGNLATNAAHLFETSGGGGGTDGDRRNTAETNVVQVSDRESFRKNLANIASGKMDVR